MTRGCRPRRPAAPAPAAARPSLRPRCHPARRRDAARTPASMRSISARGSARRVWRWRAGSTALRSRWSRSIRRWRRSRATMPSATASPTASRGLSRRRGAACGFRRRRACAGTADRVLMNPPFNVAAKSIARSRAAAWRMPLRRDAAAGCARRRGCFGRDGVLTLIWRADGLGEVLAALAADFGAIALLPVHPKPGAPAIRVLVRAIKGKPGAARAAAGPRPGRRRRQADRAGGGGAASRRALLPLWRKI